MVDDDSIKKIYQIGVENKDENLIELLQKETQLSKQLLKSAIDKGALWLKRNTNTRRLRRLKTNLLQGDELFFYYQPKILQQSVEPAQLVDSSKSYGVWYKPSGMLCQGSRWSDHCTVTRDIEKQLNRNVYLVHRLDRAASGLIIIAYHKQSAAYFANLFQQKQIKKIYHAHVHGKWNDNNTLLTINEKIDNKLAISKIIFINYCEQKNESKLESEHRNRAQTPNSQTPIGPGLSNRW